MILNDKLIREKEEIIKELNNKEKFINEYESELDQINHEHKQKVQEIVKELDDKGISINKLNTLNNKYEQLILKMAKQLDDKDVSLDEYKKINYINMYEKEIQELKKELKESKEYIDSDKIDKNMVLKKFNELYKEKKWKS